MASVGDRSDSYEEGMAVNGVFCERDRRGTATEAHQMSTKDFMNALPDKMSQHFIDKVDANHDGVVTVHEIAQLFASYEEKEREVGLVRVELVIALFFLLISIFANFGTAWAAYDLAQDTETGANGVMTTRDGETVKVASTLIDKKTMTNNGQDVTVLTDRVSGKALATETVVKTMPNAKLSSELDDETFNELDSVYIKRGKGTINFKVLGWARYVNEDSRCGTVVVLYTHPGSIQLDGTDMSFNEGVAGAFSDAGFQVTSRRRGRRSTDPASQGLLSVAEVLGKFRFLSENHLDLSQLSCGSDRPTVNSFFVPGPDGKEPEDIAYTQTLLQRCDSDSEGDSEGDSGCPPAPLTVEFMGKSYYRRTMQTRAKYNADKKTYFSITRIEFPEIPGGNALILVSDGEKMIKYTVGPSYPAPQYCTTTTTTTTTGTLVEGEDFPDGSSDGIGSGSGESEIIMDETDASDSLYTQGKDSDPEIDDTGDFVRMDKAVTTTEDSGDTYVVQFLGYNVLNDVYVRHFSLTTGDSNSTVTTLDYYEHFDERRMYALPLMPEYSINTFESVTQSPSAELLQNEDYYPDFDEPDTFLSYPCPNDLDDNTNLLVDGYKPRTDLKWYVGDLYDKDEDEARIETELAFDSSARALFYGADLNTTTQSGPRSVRKRGARKKRSSTCTVMNNRVVAVSLEPQGDYMKGTWIHTSGSGRITGSDNDCSERCTAEPECTAWQRRRSGGKCEMTKQTGTIRFEQNDFWNAGLRCGALPPSPYQNTQNQMPANSYPNLEPIHADSYPNYDQDFCAHGSAGEVDYKSPFEVGQTPSTVGFSFSHFGYFTNGKHDFRNKNEFPREPTLQGCADLCKSIPFQNCHAIGYDAAGDGCWTYRPGYGGLDPKEQSSCNQRSYIRTTFDYKAQNTGSCLAHASITSMGECSQAAVALGLSDTEPTLDDSLRPQDDPPYCYFENNELMFNADGTNTGDCDQFDTCLCKDGGITAFPTGTPTTYPTQYPTTKATPSPTGYPTPPPPPPPQPAPTPGAGTSTGTSCSAIGKRDLVLKDSYGDGWNGNMELKVIEIRAGTTTSQIGSASWLQKQPSETFGADFRNTGRELNKCIEPASCYVMQWKGNHRYRAECSWKLPWLRGQKNTGHHPGTDPYSFPDQMYQIIGDNCPTDEPTTSPTVQPTGAPTPSVKFTCQDYGGVNGAEPEHCCPASCGSYCGAENCEKGTDCCTPQAEAKLCGLVTPPCHITYQSVEMTDPQESENSEQVQILTYPNTQCSIGYANIKDKATCQRLVEANGMVFKSTLEGDGNWINGCFRHSTDKHVYYNIRPGATTGRLGGDRLCRQGGPVPYERVTGLDDTPTNCGGVEIAQLADGTEYGWKNYYVQECQKKCSASPNCDGFAYNEVTHACLWKTGIDLRAIGAEDMTKQEDLRALRIDVQHWTGWADPNRWQTKDGYSQAEIASKKQTQLDETVPKRDSLIAKLAQMEAEVATIADDVCYLPMKITVGGTAVDSFDIAPIDPNEDECRAKVGQDVKAGTFEHVAYKYALQNVPGVSSDADCSARCSAESECTAWVYIPEKKTCHMSKQPSDEIEFEYETGKTSGLRCQATCSVRAGIDLESDFLEDSNRVHNLGTESSSPADCSRQCAQQLECTAWSWEGARKTGARDDFASKCHMSKRTGTVLFRISAKPNPPSKKCVPRGGSLPRDADATTKTLFDDYDVCNNPGGKCDCFETPELARTSGLKCYGMSTGGSNQGSIAYEPTFGSGSGGAHCGGSNVDPLSDKTKYGEDDLTIAECKAKCSADPNCNAFVRRGDGACYWKKGVSTDTINYNYNSRNIGKAKEHVCYLQQTGLQTFRGVPDTAEQIEYHQGNAQCAPYNGVATQTKDNRCCPQSCGVSCGASDCTWGPGGAAACCPPMEGSEEARICGVEGNDAPCVMVVQELSNEQQERENKHKNGVAAAIKAGAAGIAAVKGSSKNSCECSIADRKAGLCDNSGLEVCMIEDPMGDGCILPKSMGRHKCHVFSIHFFEGSCTFEAMICLPTWNAESIVYGPIVSGSVMLKCQHNWDGPLGTKMEFGGSLRIALSIKSLVSPLRVGGYESYSGTWLKSKGINNDCRFKPGGKPDVFIEGQIWFTFRFEIIGVECYAKAMLTAKFDVAQKIITHGIILEGGCGGSFVKFKFEVTITWQQPKYPKIPESASVGVSGSLNTPAVCTRICHPWGECGWRGCTSWIECHNACIPSIRIKGSLGPFKIKFGKKPKVKLGKAKASVKLGAHLGG